MAAALPGGGEQDVGVGGVDGDVGDSGVVADFEGLLPGFSTVGGFVESALAAGSPQGSLRGDVDDVRIARVDGDAADVF